MKLVALYSNRFHYITRNLELFILLSMKKSHVAYIGMALFLFDHNSVSLNEFLFLWLVSWNAIAFSIRFLLFRIQRDDYKSGNGKKNGDSNRSIIYIEETCRRQYSHPDVLEWCRCIGAYRSCIVRFVCHWAGKFNSVTVYSLPFS